MPERFIPYGRQSIDDSDIDAVIETLKSDWLTQGPAIGLFEDGLKAATGAENAIAVSNATAALHISCLALGVGPGDRVWTSPNSFVASANCALYCQADVDFVDIDDTLNMSVARLAEKLEQARSRDKLPKVVIPVHFAGQSCDMRAIAALASEYGFRIIEDASHAIGGSYDDAPIGSCRYSDITVFSFHPVKIVTTAEGGAALTNDAELGNQLRLLRSHGVTREIDPASDHAAEGWYYEQVGLGFNYRITDLQAALGASQLRKLERFIARRHEVAEIYDRALANLPLTLPNRTVGRSGLHLYPIQFEDPGMRRTGFERLRAAGIGVNVHYIPIHTQPFYRDLGFRRGDFPAAEAYYERALSIPMFASMSDEDAAYVVGAVRELFH